MGTTKKFNKPFEIAFTTEQFENLKTVAEKEHKTMREMARIFISDGCSNYFAQKGIDSIQKAIRKELDLRFEAFTNRTVALTAKTCNASFRSVFLLMQLFEILSEQDNFDLPDLEEMYEMAKKKAAGALKAKDNDIKNADIED